MLQDRKAVLEKLRDVTRLLLDAVRPAYSLRNEVLELKSIFEAAVFGKHVVKDYDAGITYPRNIPADIRIKSGDSVEFTYRTGIKPGISARRIGHD